MRRTGQINRALPAGKLTPFVEKLARRIASFPPHAIAHAKAAVDAGAFHSLAEGLLVEAHESDLSVASEVTQERVREALKAGAETLKASWRWVFYRSCPQYNELRRSNQRLGLVAKDVRFQPIVQVQAINGISVGRHPVAKLIEPRLGLFKPAPRLIGLPHALISHG